MIFFIHDSHQGRGRPVHVRHHAFSRQKTFVPRCQRRPFNNTFERSQLSMVLIAYGLCFIWNPLKIIPLVAQGIISMLFKPQRSDQGFL